MLTHLMTGSRHHLDAFTNAVNGGTDAAFCTGTGAQLGVRGDGRGTGMSDGTGMGTGYRGPPRQLTQDADETITLSHHRLG